MTIHDSTEFFIDSGCVSDDQMALALRERDALKNILIGEVLVRLNIVNQEILDDALAEQIREVSQAGLVHRRRLGEVLVDLQHITEAQLELALDEQRRLRALTLGGLLIELGMLSIQELDDLVAGQMKKLTVAVA